VFKNQGVQFIRCMGMSSSGSRVSLAHSAPKGRRPSVPDLFMEHCWPWTSPIIPQPVGTACPGGQSIDQGQDRRRGVAQDGRRRQRARRGTLAGTLGKHFPLSPRMMRSGGPFGVP
jgi:hypothetical protein